MARPTWTTGRPQVLLGTAAALLLTLAAGCGSDGGGDEAATPSGGADPTTTTEAVPEPLRSCAAVTETTERPEGLGGVVEMIDFEFCQTDLTVEAGQVVEFVNRGGARHQVKQIEADDGFSSDVMAPGKSFVLPLSEPGTYTYVCAFHSQMMGSITVT